MKNPNFLKTIRDIILKGKFEDNDRELELALYHLERSKRADDEYRRLVKGLKKGIPVSRIIGYSLVCGIPIRINEDVLDPGPETVTLVKEAIKYIKLEYPSSALDLCCGSGAAAIAIAKICKIHVTAIDISEPALKVARVNTLTNNVRIEFLQGDLFQPVEGRKFDIIVSNPPYVKTAKIASLPRFIRNFAPKIAIDGGVDGLYFHRKILSQAGKFLNNLGLLFLECEDGQDEDVIELCRLNNWDVAEKYLNRYGKIRGFKLFKK